MASLFVSFLALLAVSDAAAPRYVLHDFPDVDTTQGKLTLSPYAPSTVACPSTPLVRPATGISSAEATYIKSRKHKANSALEVWLKRTCPEFNTTGAKLPTIGLTSSGGGLRALLTGAGVIQAIDDRDGDDSVAGLYQALTYESGLSGGGWLLSSFSGNNWPTITKLKTTIWETTFMNSLLLPENLLAGPAYAAITNDVVAKDAAGYHTTLTDPYGRLLGYLLLNGTDGGVVDELSGLTGYSNFTSHAVPYPIITSIGVPLNSAMCVPAANGTQYELSPYEFGSWDAGVHAFTQMKYLGTPLNNGMPTNASECTIGFDNLGFVAGTTSSLFNELCIVVPDSNATANLFTATESIVNKAHTLTTADDFAQYPNPFKGYAASSGVSADPTLRLVDGGETDQNNPIWPFLHRQVDVLLVNDNSADTTNNYPNGSELYQTYLQAKNDNLSKMPIIPTADVFVAEGLNKRPTFFGCNDNSTITIVYLANTNYTFDSGQSTFKLQYSKNETDAMIANGRLVGSYDNNATWAECLGCAIMKKTHASLPQGCNTCFNSFCYN